MAERVHPNEQETDRSDLGFIVRQFRHNEPVDNIGARHKRSRTPEEHARWRIKIERPPPSHPEGSQRSPRSVGVWAFPRQLAVAPGRAVTVLHALYTRSCMLIWWPIELPSRVTC